MARADEVLPPSRLREKRRKTRIIKRTLWVLLFLLCVAGSVAVLHLNAIRIEEVAIDGVHEVSAAEVEKAVFDVLAGSYWYVIPKNSVAVYSAAALQADLLRDFPKLSAAKVTLDTFQRIQVTVTERSPVGLWCGASVPADTAYECYFLDESGYVYEQAPEYSGSAYVRWYGALNDQSVPAYFQKPDVFRSLRALIDSFTNSDQTPERVMLDENGDVFVLFAEGFELRFALAQKPEDILASLRTARTAPVLADKKLSDLLYLDLRFGDRLYYKFK